MGVGGFSRQLAAAEERRKQQQLDALQRQRGQLGAAEKSQVERELAHEMNLKLREMDIEKLKIMD